jgi:hypothetical protein
MSIKVASLPTKGAECPTVLFAVCVWLIKMVVLCIRPLESYLYLT